MSLKEADSLVPQLQLPKLLKSLAPKNYDVDRIIVMAPGYLKTVSKLLEETPRDTIQAYLEWKVIQVFGGYIEADAIKPYKRFTNELQGKVSRRELILRESHLTYCRILSPLLNAGGPASTTSMAAWAGSSADSSWRKPSPLKQRRLVIRSSPTSKINSSRS